ncbi:hypothetical protein C8R47DRAFT_1226185 [Mycena vitilis]|nr:hypothetical protein C8R47DRAFT_1226185 [Mycena vitilis]
MQLLLQHASFAAPESQTGFFSTLPAELKFKIIGHTDLRARVYFALTCKAISFFCDSYLHHDLLCAVAAYNLDLSDIRFMLVATGTLMTGYAIQRIFVGFAASEPFLDFFAARMWTPTVLTAVQSGGSYTADPVPVDSGMFVVWTLRSGAKKIRVFQCNTFPLDAILTRASTHTMGYCDGRVVRHAYPDLALQGRTLTSPHSLVIHDTIHSHREAWTLIQAAVRSGWTWATECDFTHKCGRCFSCPATGRHSQDDGWVCMKLPAVRYGRPLRLPIVSWCLHGAGCEAGFLQGPFPSLKALANFAILYQEWIATVNTFVKSSTPPMSFLKYGA